MCMKTTFTRQADVLEDCEVEESICACPAGFCLLLKAGDAIRIMVSLALSCSIGSYS